MAKRIFREVKQQACLTKESIKNYYRLKYFNLYMNAYKFTGLDYQQKDFLLRKMWSVGRVACFKLDQITEAHPQGEIVLCPFATATLNIYDYPVLVSLIKLKNVDFIWLTFFL